jgi:hypothetical protein
MTPEPPQISILDARLAEIDGRLRTIQQGLVVDEPAPPEQAPRTSLPPPIEVPGPAASPPQPLTPAALLDELRRLADAHGRLADAHERLANAHERLLASVRELVGSYESGRRSPEPTPLHAVTVAVGPLGSSDGLRAFERALADVPGVRAVELSGYQGADRAVLDVQLELTS